MSPPDPESVDRPPAPRVGPIDVYAYSVPGLGKDTNEDRVAWRGQDGIAVLLVSDGVSTCDLGSGEQAAEEVIRLFRARYAHRFDQLAAYIKALDLTAADTQWQEEGALYLRDFFDEANARVVSAQDALLPALARVPDYPMCATLTMALIVFDQVLIASVGDSPVWLYRDGTLQQVTQDDHACRQPGYRPDLDPPNALTRFVGRGMFDTDRQTIRPLPLEVGPMQMALKTGDLLLVGSDGLVQCIDAAELPEKTDRMCATLTSALSEGLLLPRLVQRVIRLGEDGLSDDNITLCAARIGVIGEVETNTAQR